MAQKILQRSSQRFAPEPKRQAIAVDDLPPANHFIAYLLAFFAVMLVGFQIYSPALRGQFVFDDLFLSYTNPHAASFSLAQWCGLRPILGLSFWANFQASGLNPLPYHAVNILLHCFSSILLFFIARKLLALVGTTGVTAQLLAGFAGTIFLVHPMQTEAVAYIASRSENLSVFFLFAAFGVFLYRRSAAVSWPESVAILILFACAVGTKEHALMLPAIFLLTDYFFNPAYTFSGIRANWRLYIPITFVALAATVFVWSYVSRDAMIGFHLQGLTWYQYFFTQCRALFAYVWLFLVPVGLNVDHQFAESFTVFDHGAIFAITAVACLIAAAIFFRRRYPLAAYGFLVFIALLAPTSSFIPIRDVFVERRMYLPLLGLLLISLEVLRRLHLQPKILALVLAVFCVIPAYLTWRRAGVWISSIRLWEDSVSNAPEKSRPHIGLGNAYMHEGRCSEAVREYQAAYRLDKPDFTLKYNLAVAYDCNKQPAPAIPLLTEAIAENPKSAPNYALLGMVYAETGKVEEAFDYLNRAEKLDPKYALPHAYRGLILHRFGRPDLAKGEFGSCLQLDPNNQVCRRGWTELTQAGQ
jgi:tetratricopeptide (TPR) repeat protein